MSSAGVSAAYDNSPRANAARIDGASTSSVPAAVGLRRSLPKRDIITNCPADREEGAHVLTATKDLVLPTTLSGTWPRTSWFDGNLHERPFSTGMADVRCPEQFIDAEDAKIRGELGASQSDVRAADPGLQVDVPAVEPEAVSA